MARSKTFSGVVVVFVAAMGIALAGEARTWSFEQDVVDAAPGGFTFATTLDAPAGRWVVQQDGDQKVLAQVDQDRTDRRFAMAVVDSATYGDVRLSVRGKPVSGEIDQAVGLVWRWQGPNDYYVARSNVLERNVRLYRVVNGNRIKFAGVENVELRGGQWHTLGVEHVGARIRVLVDGRELFQAEDRTFAQPGKVGLWVKADSVTRFDDFTVESLARE